MRFILVEKSVPCTKKLRLSVIILTLLITDIETIIFVLRTLK